jgi:hypothetical protein
MAGLKSTHLLSGALCVLGLATAASAASISVAADYTVDQGGNNNAGPSGLSARAEFELVSTTLTVRLSNTSTGVPAGAEVSDALLTSLAFDLPAGVGIASGTGAAIAAGSTGLGSWSGRGAGDSVADDWVWTDGGAGDLLQVFGHAITTSQGQGGASASAFGGGSAPNVSGPFGGIISVQTQGGFNFNGNKFAVSDAIVFVLELTGGLTETQLSAVASGAWVEFGSDYQYLSTDGGGGSTPIIPLPGAALLSVAGGLGLASTRRRLD